MTTNLKRLADVLKKATPETRIKQQITDQREMIVETLRESGSIVVTDDRGRKFRITVQRDHANQ